MALWKKELKRIITFLNTAPSADSRALWQVLTALRGPDTEDVAEKNSTTAVIRHAIGLRHGVGGAVVGHDSLKRVAMRNRRFPASTGYFGVGLRLSRYTHFSNHALLAFKALGLDWENNNVRVPSDVLADQKEDAPCC